MKIGCGKLLIMIGLAALTVNTITNCQKNSQIKSLDPTGATTPPPNQERPCNSTSPASPIATDKLEEIAKKSTVYISGRSKGSGVIIGKNSGTYYVLTADHVVAVKPGEDEDPYKVITEDNQEGYKADYEKEISNIDLAILKFTSKKKYLVATLNKSPISSGISVYVSGFIPCSSSEDEGNAKQYQFSEGITSDASNIKSKLKSEGRQNIDRYDVYYSNKTLAGMSGGPVFDEAGRVVAIHTSATQRKETSVSCQSAIPEDAGGNLGVSISKLLNSNQLPPYIVKQLDCSPSPKGTVKSTNDLPKPTNTSTPVFTSPSVPTSDNNNKTPGKRECKVFEPPNADCEASNSQMPTQDRSAN